MGLFIEQCEHSQTEEPCEECSPEIESDEIIDISEYDYHKRLWF